MKSVALLCLVAFVAAQQDVPIVKQVFDIQGDGAYSYEIETGNGIRQQERGYQKPGPEEPIQVAEGSFSYTADDGTPISLTYIADENGFQPQGAHLPTPHPIPEYILRSLELIEKANAAAAGKARGRGRA